MRPTTVGPPPPGAPSTGNRRGLRLLAGLFTLTGATALLAEQSFEKLLGTLLGATTPATATVLAMYFGGLTLGGLLFGRWRRTGQTHPLRLYGFLEFSVGVWSLFLFLAFDHLIPFFVPLLALGRDRFWVLQGLRVVVAACWILPATVPMGATFPAMVDALQHLGVPERGKAMARFYTSNLLGAILGAVGGPFLIFPYWGVDGAMLLAFAVNLSVALLVFPLARTLQRGGGAPPPLEAAAEAAARPQPYLVFALAFFSGFLFFALEVVWAHLIGAVLGCSIYAFAAMLAAVLLGLTISGAQVATRFPANTCIPRTELGRLLLLGALALALMNGLWPDVPQALTAFGPWIRTFAVAESWRWLLAAAMVLPPTLLLGMIYPLLFRLDIFPSRQASVAMGRTVAANSLGCIGGALLAGFWLIPRLGSERTLVVLTVGTVAWGMAVWWMDRSPTRPARLLWLGLATCLVLALQPRWNKLNLTSGKHVYFLSANVRPGTVLKFFHEDTRGGITTVVENTIQTNRGPQRQRVLLTNGKFQGNDGDEMEAQTAFALVPMMFVPRLERALAIGLGTGRSAYLVAAMGFTAIDVAEIAPGIVQAARDYFRHINGSVLDQPQVRLFLEDGRNVLLLRDEQYDLITMELTSVWFAGATNLYSEQFYRLARRRLKPGGVFQQWIQLHHIGQDELLTAIATLRTVFPYVSFWVVGGQGIMVGSLTPQVIEPAFLQALARHAAALGWTAPELAPHLSALVSSRLLAPEDVTALVRQESVRLNTDRNRRLEYFTPRYNYSHIDYRRRNLAALARFASFPPPTVAAGCDGPLAVACRQVNGAQYRQRFGLPLTAAPTGGPR